VKLHEIAQIILKKHDVTLEFLKSKNRTKKAVQARIEFIRLSFAHNKTANAIARFLDKDHTTVLHHKWRNMDAWERQKQIEMDL
jgi:chromosomal replication initiation ATPase DnaA